MFLSPYNRTCTMISLFSHLYMYPVILLSIPYTIKNRLLWNDPIRSFHSSLPIEKPSIN